MEDKTTPVFEMLLNTANARLKEYEELLGNTREVVDRINARKIKPEVASTRSLEPTTNIENTVVNGFASFLNSFEQANKRMEELYARLRELA